MIHAADEHVFVTLCQQRSTLSTSAMLCYILAPADNSFQMVASCSTSMTQSIVQSLFAQLEGSFDQYGNCVLTSASILLEFTYTYSNSKREQVAQGIAAHACKCDGFCAADRPGVDQITTQEKKHTLLNGILQHQI